MYIFQVGFALYFSLILYLLWIVEVWNSFETSIIQFHVYVMLSYGLARFFTKKCCNHMMSQTEDNDFLQRIGLKPFGVTRISDEKDVFTKTLPTPTGLCYKGSEMFCRVEVRSWRFLCYGTPLATNMLSTSNFLDGFVDGGARKDLCCTIID